MDTELQRILCCISTPLQQLCKFTKPTPFASICKNQYHNAKPLEKCPMQPHHLRYSYVLNQNLHNDDDDEDNDCGHKHETINPRETYELSERRRAAQDEVRGCWCWG